MFPSDLVASKTEFAHQACKVCKTHALDPPRNRSRFFRAQAHVLACQGKAEAAAAKLAEADRLEHNPEK